MTTLALKLNTLKLSARPARCLNRRPLSQRLELAAVLSLLGSSAAYALFALCHLA